MGYVLYKPIFDKDEQTQRDNLDIYIAGQALDRCRSCTLCIPATLFKDITIDLSVVYYVYYSFYYHRY